MKTEFNVVCVESLVKLHAHWLTDLQFSLTLLSQFLEDMEAYAEACLMLSFMGVVYFFSDKIDNI